MRSRALALLALLLAPAATLGAQAAPPRLPFGSFTPVRVTVDGAQDVQWTRVPGGTGRAVNPSAPSPRPPGGLLEGTFVGPSDRDTLLVQRFVAGDSAGTTAAGSTWQAAVPWSAVRTVERREDDARAIRRGARRLALRGALLGAAIGAAASSRDRAAGAAVGGASLWLLGYIFGGQGASVSAPPCWRLVYDRALATARVQAEQPPHLGGEGRVTCPAS